MLPHDLQCIPRAVVGSHCAQGGNGGQPTLAAFCPDVCFADKATLNGFLRNVRFRVRSKRKLLGKIQHDFSNISLFTESLLRLFNFVQRIDLGYQRLDFFAFDPPNKIGENLRL